MSDCLITAPASWRLDAAMAAAVREEPDRLAIVGGSIELTMARLDHSANVLAARIVAAGVAPGAFVIVATATVTGFMVAALAALKSGCAYVPIDLRFPIERARELLGSGIADLVVADAALPPGLVAVGIPQLLLDVPALVAAPTAIVPDRPPGEIAYVCFTSGSTGAPKGVLVGHSGIEGLLLDPEFRVFRRGGRTAQVTTFAFDATTLEVWGSLLAGSTLVEVPPGVISSPAKLAEFLRDEAITAAWFSTGYFNLLVDHSPGMFAAMETVIIGGEAADARVIARLFGAGHPPARLLNGYGPTEATTLASWHEIVAADGAAGVIPIGRVFAGRRLLVVDEQLRPVPPGDDGELLIAGPAVAHGYWRAPDRTAERFLPDPERPGGLMYRTGDRCRFNEHGQLLYFGRMDDQVKIRGFRVEPGHIARELMALPHVVEAVVLPRTTPLGRRELVGFITTDSPLEGAAVRAALAARIADFMVPSAIVPVAAFPLGANGKLDRAKLLELTERSAVADAPRTAMQARLMDVLGAASPATRLDELATDSMAQVELLIQLETELGREIGPETLATLPDITALAEWLDAASSSPAQTFVIALPWALNPLPPELVGAIAGDGEHVVIPLSPDGLDLPERAIATLADHAVARIAARATGEPVVLAGYSIAGIVAAETATRLAAAGREVAMVVLLDADVGEPTLAARLVGRLARLARRSPARAPSPIDAIMRRARRAVALWQPGTLPMPVVAIHSTDGELVGAAQWRRRSAGEFRGACVPGSHLDLVANPATTRQVAAIIARARADFLVAGRSRSSPGVAELAPFEVVPEN